jgi:hypothetical protein
MNPHDPTQRMRNILEALQQPSKKPYPGEKLKRTNIALAELSEVMDGVRIDELTKLRAEAYMVNVPWYATNQEVPCILDKDIAYRISALQQPKPSEETE